MIRMSTTADAFDLAPRLREEDKREIEVLTGLGPLEALAYGRYHSDICYTALKNGKVVGMAGVVRLDEHTGSVWFLSSHEVTKYPRELLQESKRFLGELQGRYRTLTNYVTANNKLHLRLIRHLGFEIGEPLVLPGSGERIVKFERNQACALLL